jgi:hypothetical protein
MENNSAVTVELLERARAGDQAALNEIFSRHRERLRRMVDIRLDRRLHARVDASEVMHRLIKQVTDTGPAPLDRLSWSVHRDLVTVVHKAIDLDPANRYQTAAELAFDLYHLLDDQPILARRPSVTERLLRLARHDPGLAASLAVIGLLLIAATVISAVAAGRFRAVARENAALAGQREEERDKAEHPCDAERWERYRANIAAATSALQLQNIHTAQTALEAAPDEHRNWEWRHLHNQLKSPRTVLRSREKGQKLGHPTLDPAGKQLAAWDEGARAICVWDVATSNELPELRGHEDMVHVLAYSLDGTRVASASGDFTVRIWDTLPADVRAALPTAYLPPRGYVCYRAQGPVVIDGKLDDAAWRAVPWTEDFVDIEGDLRPAPRFRTRAKMLWDDKYFYIGAELQEPQVWGTLTKHDSVIFNDNDFEVFIDPDGDNHNYAELELNALNTTWDLLLKKPYRDGGPALNEWEIPGLKTAVRVDGTLNDPRDTDRGWTVEIAIPWEVLGKLADVSAPPRDGDQWRVNFSRVEWRHEVVNGQYRKLKGGREDNWVWSPQGVVDMHRPEKWGYVQFSTAAPGKATFLPDPAGPARHLLHQIYYAQKSFHKEHKSYARTLEELHLAGLHHESVLAPPQLEANDDHFHATVAVRYPDGRSKHWRIREDSRVWQLDGK